MVNLSKKTLPELEELFKDNVKKWRELNDLIQVKKQYWSKDMLRTQHKRSRELTRERNHIKMLIETHKHYKP